MGKHLGKDRVPARVTAAYSWQYEIIAPEEPAKAELTGKLRYNTLYSAQSPVIGDWVAARKIDVDTYMIDSVLPRAGCLQRQKVDGDPEAQVLAANVDVSFVVQSLHGDFNLARLDRYIALAANAKVKPVVVLTKADLVPNASELAEQVKRTYQEIEVFVISAVTGQGTEELKNSLEPGKTYVALGSSGVGKSTLLNCLSGQQLMATSEVREDDQRGRHTTTHRQMFLLPNGSLFIDTPGIRELALFEHDGLDQSFKDVAELAHGCKFKDCGHDREPGCAVRRAIEAGELSEERLENYRKMQREAKAYKTKQILLNKKVAKTKIKRRNTHYKDFVRGGGRNRYNKY